MSNPQASPQLMWPRPPGKRTRRRMHASLASPHWAASSASLYQRCSRVAELHRCPAPSSLGQRHTSTEPLARPSRTSNRQCGLAVRECLLDAPLPMIELIGASCSRFAIAIAYHFGVSTNFTVALPRIARYRHNPRMGLDSAPLERILLSPSRRSQGGEVIMRPHSFGLLAGTGLAVALPLNAGDARASTFDVTIDSTSLSGSPAVLAFDFHRRWAARQYDDAERAYLRRSSGFDLDHRECHRDWSVDVLGRRRLLFQ